MKKKNSTQKALLTSVLSLLLCASMLVGTTFAWFTDSVSTGVNTIASGNLDVDVFYGDPALKQSIEGIDTLFNDVKLWEPGAVAYENLTVANLGSLALKYTVGVAFTGENYILENGQPVYSLPDILQVGLVPGGVDESLSREAIVASVNEWFPMETYVWEDELLAETNDETMGVVIWWEPSASDNNWNVQNGKQTDDGADHLHVDLGITLAATQLVHENDSFDNTYDQTAKLPMVAGGTLNVGAVTVVVPENAPAGDYELKVNKFDLVLDTNHDAVLDADFAVLKDGVAVTPGQLEYEVQLQLDIMAKDFVVTHNGNPISEYAYDVFTGLLTFTTDSFSPFGVTYEIFGKDVAVEGREILRGFFSKGVDPRTIDTTLADSTEYMTVHFQKDGQDIWSVSKTADTLFIGKTAGTYTDANGNEHAITVETGNLYKIISDLTANDHNTIYILPGTYNEGTTIYVYSSMDIVGLGDTGTVKLVKTSSSNSNRHL